jgi:hypothetical protein
VPKESFSLETSWDDIKTYQFGTKVAKHYFCGTCGISPFYVPRSNPNGYSVLCGLENIDNRSIFDVLTESSFRRSYGMISMGKIGRQLLRRVILAIVVKPSSDEQLLLGAYGNAGRVNITHSSQTLHR